jgi:hypothetical protein
MDIDLQFLAKYFKVMESVLRILYTVRWVPSLRARQTYNGDFAPELVLDLALFKGIRTLLLNYGEELLDAHICGNFSSSAPCCSVVVLL